jgi:hypothetical protein
MRSILLILLAATAISLAAGEQANGQQPVGTPQTIDFTEDLVIGPEDGDDAYIWAGLNVFVSVNHKGHMFITDSSQNRVVQLDPAGKYVRTIGGFGQGPGEFQTLGIFQILVNGSAVAFENRQSGGLQYFDTNMRFERRKRLTGVGQDFLFAYFSANGRWFASEFVTIDLQAKTLSYRTGIYSTEPLALRKVLTNSTRPYPDFNNLMGNRDGIIEFLAQTISANDNLAYVQFDDQNRIYTARSQEYKVTIWDPTLLKQLLTVSREYKPIAKGEAELEALCEAIRDQLPFPDQVKERITIDMIRQAYDRAEVPLVKNPIFGIVPMPEGRFLVVHNFNQTDGNATADIFDGEGRFIGQVSRPNQSFVGSANLFGGHKIRMIFKGKYAYTIETRDQDNVLVRYRYQLRDAG